MQQEKNRDDLHLARNKLEDIEKKEEEKSMLM